MPQHRHIIIDAFNVIFGEEHLKALFEASQDDAKQSLIQMAQVLHDVDGHQVSLVFDGRGKKIDVEHPLRADSFTVIHSTSSLSADGVIERMIARSKNTDRIIVVTNDQLIRDATIACGAEPMRVHRFVDFVHSTERRGMQQMKRNQRNIKTEWNNRIPL